MINSVGQGRVVYHSNWVLRSKKVRDTALSSAERDLLFFHGEKLKLNNTNMLIEQISSGFEVPIYFDIRRMYC
jgi:hypothetical protein